MVDWVGIEPTQTYLWAGLLQSLEFSQYSANPYLYYSIYCVAFQAEIIRPGVDYKHYNIELRVTRVPYSLATKALHFNISR